MFEYILFASNKQLLQNNINHIDYTKNKIHIIDMIGDIKYDHFNVIVYKYEDIFDTINNILKYIKGNVVILESNIKINNESIKNLDSYYNNEALNLLRTDTVRDVVLNDKRIGKNTIQQDDITLNIAFNTNKIKSFDSFDDLYIRCISDRIPILFQSNIRVLRSALSKNPIRKNPLVRPTKKERDIQALINKSKNLIKYDIIIPFMYNGDRWDLFVCSIESLYRHFKNNANVNIIIHETSPTRYITKSFIKKYDIQYMYSKWDDVFHRAWALNVPAKHKATGDVFVFFDADLLITEEWKNELLSSHPDKVYIGWGKMYNLSKQATKYYIKNRTLLKEYERIRVPASNAAAGGINIIPRSVFFDVCGWDESFEGTYGGEDNVMYCKLDKLGYNPNNKFKSYVYHLYHEHMTYRDPKRIPLYRKIASYNKDKWINIINTFEWGELNYKKRNSISTNDSPLARNNKKSTLQNNSKVSLNKEKTEVFRNYYNSNIMRELKYSKKPVITICMVTYKRFDTLINTLKRMSELKIKANMLLWINDYKYYTQDQLDVINGIVSSTFVSYDIIYCPINVGTGHSRNIMLKRAIKEFDSKYILTTDDDIYYNSVDELLIGSCVLEQKRFSNIGCIGIWHEPGSKILRIKDDKIQNYDPVYGLQTTDAIGAATMTIRKDVIKSCNVDPEYKIMWVDTDFCMSVRKAGYKVAFLCNKRWKPKNIADLDDESYKKDRYDDTVRKESTDRFKSKWGIEPVWRRLDKKSDIIISEDSTKDINVLWMKMDTSDRVASHLNNEYLEDELSKLCNLDIHRENIGNQHPSHFQNNAIRNKNYDLSWLIKKQNEYDAIIIRHPFAFNTDDWKNVNVPVFMMLEDQHGDNNRYSIQMGIKYGWIVLTRYELKDFNNDLNQQIKKHYLYPHYIDDDIFKDYGLEKERVVLQTGALYKVYACRNALKSSFEKENLSEKYYKYIPRPKETDVVKYPIGVDYAKEINKSWFTICCGSTYRYPVMKYFEIPACGSIIYGHYFDDLEKLGFIPDENMIVADLSSPKKQIDSLMQDKDNLLRIIENGKSLIKERYTKKMGAKVLLQIIKNDL